MQRLRRAYEWVASRRWALVTIQLTALGVLLFFFGWAFRGAWQEAKPLLRHADLSDLALSTAILIVQAIAVSQPPPSANPLTAATTGLPRFSMRSRTTCPKRLDCSASNAAT